MHELIALATPHLHDSRPVRAWGGDLDPERRLRRRRRSTTAVAISTLAAFSLLAAACGDEDVVSATPGSSVPVDVELIASSLDVVAGDFDFSLGADRIAAGLVTVNLRNDGAQDHHVTLVRLNDGVTAQQWVDTMHSDGEAAAYELGAFAGGVNPVASGETGSIVTDLEPGRYLLLCFVPSPDDGVPHVHKGMHAEVEVVQDPDAEPVAVPEAIGEVVMADYTITPPEGGLIEPGWYRFVNRGTEPHEVVFVRLKDGRTMADVAAYQAAGGQGEAPFTFESGTAAVDPGGVVYAEVDLRPGSWLAVCVIRSAVHDKAHLDLGMLLPFDIAG